MTDFPLDGEGPLHAQIRRAVAQAILSGRIPPGGRIPAEAERMTLVGPSRWHSLPPRGGSAAPPQPSPAWGTRAGGAALPASAPRGQDRA